MKTVVPSERVSLFIVRCDLSPRRSGLPVYGAGDVADSCVLQERLTKMWKASNSVSRARRQNRP